MQDTMNRYTASTSHTVGYRWEIDAPAGLSAKDIQLLVEAYIDYSDEPSTEELREFLSDSDYADTFEEELLPLLKQVEIHVETVHREVVVCNDVEEGA